MIGWDDSGIVVARGLPGAEFPVRVDPVTGAASAIANLPGRDLKAWSKSLNSPGPWEDAKHRTHVFQSDEGFLLWSAPSRHEEFLFALPSEHEGFPNRHLLGPTELVARRHAATIHRIWSASTRQEADSARFIVETYVPRPGSEPKDYMLSLQLEMPDTSSRAEDAFKDRRVPLARRGFRLGPTATTLQLAVPNRQLRDLIRPYRRDMRPPSWSGTVDILLRPVPIAGTDWDAPPGLWAGIASVGETSVTIPIR